MRLFPLLLLTGLTLPAHAVIVRGLVTSPLGRPVAGARIQLISLNGPAASIADSVSGVDGAYEIRSDQSGRFLLLTSSLYFAPQLSPGFYGGRSDVLTRDVALDPNAIAAQISSVPTGLPTPQAELATPTAQVTGTELTSRALIPDALSVTSAAVLLDTGELLQPQLLFLRGASPAGLAVTLDGEPLNPLGRAFDLARIGTTGLSGPLAAAALDLGPGPDPLLTLTADAGTLSLSTGEGTSWKPTLDYNGDAGDLHTYRNDVSATFARRRYDLLGEVSRLDTSNALPGDRAHLASAAANLGYNIAGSTTLRLTLRQDDSAAPLPIPYDLGLQPVTRDAGQRTAGTFTFDTRTARAWHNQLRYGLDRDRDQTLAYRNPGGRPVTLTGASGVTVTGTASSFPLPPRQDQATDRDTITYTTDYPLTHHITGLLLASCEDQRALDQFTNLLRATLNRRNFTVGATLQAQLRHRLFAETSGELTHSTLLGTLGTPRLGLTYVPVIPAQRRFHGTALHLTVATGLREPGTAAQLQAAQLRQNAIPARTRTLSASIDQSLLREHMLLRAAYFHNQFAHEPEPLSQSSVLNGAILPGQPQLAATQAYRTQGLTLDARYYPRTRIVLTAAYTYLASLVEQSTAVAGVNPTLPAIPIGALTPLAGARLFHRPPNSGAATAAYNGRLLTATLQASFAGRADTSTYLAQTPTLLLPNRNLAPAYTRLDASLAFALSRRLTAFTQLDNVLNDQHLGEFGYPATPFLVRAGLKIRLTGE